MALLSHRVLCRALVGIGIVAGLTTPVPAAEDAEALRKSLQAACETRLRALEREERENLERIDWEVSPAGVRGVYLGFAKDFTCRRSDDPDGPPTARLNYQEVVYEKRGKNAQQARAAQPKPIEIRNVTLVLVYRSGHWY